jgi:hypothetical protein
MDEPDSTPPPVKCGCGNRATETNTYGEQLCHECYELWRYYEGKRTVFGVEIDEHTND